MSKSKRIYSFEIPSDFENQKMTPQVYQILSGISESGVSEYSETELKTFVQKLADDGKLKTGQKPWRIFQYYRAQMINAGICKMSNVEDSEEKSEAVNQ
jgi:hypothetical protein|tara:strand:+ start:82 stop:378 length:297 start_codon:yes stop_codon:yes gene_type:complete